jgi:hypothetical protein
LGKQWTVIRVEKFHKTRTANQIMERWNIAAFREFAKKECGKESNPSAPNTELLRD